MFKRKEIELLKEKLLRLVDNHTDLLVSRTGLSRPTVSKFLNFQKVRPVNASKIYDAALELIHEESTQHRSRLKRAKEVIFWEEEDSQTTLNL